jgi:2-keto-4-pentenoate hydratase/2-oxohepta-3-ene-1,7-dioic acid hydratase in catechol pathway
MKFARVHWMGQPVWVEIEGDRMYRLGGSPFNAPRRGEFLGAITNARLLAPIEQHNKIIGLLGNYGSKGKRAGPGFFVKPNSAVVAQGDPIVKGPRTPSINFESELGVVIGRRAKNVPLASALDHVFGYTIVNDVTSFPVQREDGNLSTRFKAFDTFCPIGPWIVTGLDGQRLRVVSQLNGAKKQDTPTSEMAFSVAECIAWISAALTLEPGDVISTGTPPGNAEMQPGDIIECEIEGIGVLRNPVQAA